MPRPRRPTLTTTQRGYGAHWQRLRRAVLARDRYVCHVCGLPGADAVDHVHPKRWGGTDDWSNLRAIHGTCNSRKRDTIPTRPPRPDVPTESGVLARHADPRIR